MSVRWTTCPPRLANLRRALRAVLTVLMAASALSLAFAGPAAAGVGTGVPIALNSLWSGNAGFGTIPPAAYLDDYGDVHLWGAARQKLCVNPRGCAGAGPPDLLGTLPEGPYTPQRNVFTITHTNFGTYADVEIRTNGQIWLIDPRPPAVRDYSFVSLEGISYDPLNPSDSPRSPIQIQLNGNNWSPDMRFDTGVNMGTPAVYSDGGGTVHLEGAVTQTSTGRSPLGPNVIGTIPESSNLVPANNVYEIAHTNFGTYADVEITSFEDPNPGEIVLIGARLPAVQDYSFVSLEGISYSMALAQTPLLPQNNWFYYPPSSTNFTTPFGADTAHAVEDSAGIVHLAGGIVETSCCTAAGELIARLQDASFAPSWNVFEIVHTLAGTYADIEVETDGTIHVIPPRAPAGSDFGFLSLEGITFAAASPKFFVLGVHGTEQHGATITVTLRKSRVLALRVRRTRRHRLVTIGAVHLGHHRAGRSHIRWNLRVNGRLLRPGRYQVSLHALNDSILSVPAPPGPRTIRVLANGHVQMEG